MATRSRTASASLALLVQSVSGGEAPEQLSRVQSINYGVSIPKETVQQYGNTAPISREQINPPEVTLDFSYYVTTVDNEWALGLYVTTGDQSVLKYILDNTQDEKNYYVFVAPDGADANGLTGADGKVKGFGNGFINSFSVEGAVGSFPTSTVSVIASNIVAYNDGVSEPVPAVDPTTGVRITGANFTIPTLTSDWAVEQPKVIRPGDITVNLASATGLFHNVATACVQSFALNVNLNREPLSCLGSKFPRSREITFPIEATLQVDILANDIVTGDLTQFVCLTGLYNADITMRNSVCNGTGDTMIRYSMRNMSLESQNWSTQYGVLGETITLNYTAFVGGSGDLANGLFVSGLLASA